MEGGLGWSAEVCPPLAGPHSLPGCGSHLWPPGSHLTHTGPAGESWGAGGPSPLSQPLTAHKGAQGAKGRGQGRGGEVEAGPGLRSSMEAPPPVLQTRLCRGCLPMAGPPPPGPQGLRHVPRADTGRVAPRPLHIAFPSILYQARSLRGPGPQLTATGHTWQRAAGGPVGGRLQPAARGWLPLLPQVLTEGGKREAPVLTPNPSQARKPTGHTSLEGQGSAFGSASRGPQPRAPDAGPGALDRKEAGEPAQPSGGHCRWSMWGWGPLSCRGGGGLHLQRRLVGGVH